MGKLTTQVTAEFNGKIYKLGALYIGSDNTIFKLTDIHNGDFRGVDVSGNIYQDDWLIAIEDSHFSGVEIGTVTKAPLELINGQAYQFENRLIEVLIGIYNSDRNILSVEQGRYFDVEAATNIKPLKVN